MLTLYFLVPMPPFTLFMSLCPSLVIGYVNYSSLTRMQVRKKPYGAWESFPEMSFKITSENKEMLPRIRNWENKQKEKYVQRPRVQTKRILV